MYVPVTVILLATEARPFMKSAAAKIILSLFITNVSLEAIDISFQIAFVSSGVPDPLIKYNVTVTAEE